MNNKVNWHELKVYFEAADNPKSYETRYKARFIKQMLEDHSNFLYFHLAVPIVQKFEKSTPFFSTPRSTRRYLIRSYSFTMKASTADYILLTGQQNLHGSQLRIFKKEELSARTLQKNIFARHSLTHRLLGLYRNASPTLLGKRNHFYF